MLGLRAKGFGHPLHFIGVVDRVAAILVVPGRGEASSGFFESVVGLGGVPTRAMKGLCQLGDLKRATGLQALVDRPWIAAGRRDQFCFAQVFHVIVPPAVDKHRRASPPPSEQVQPYYRKVYGGSVLVGLT